MPDFRPRHLQEPVLLSPIFQVVYPNELFSLYSNAQQCSAMLRNSQQCSDSNISQHRIGITWHSSCISQQYFISHNLYQLALALQISLSRHRRSEQHVQSCLYSSRLEFSNKVPHVPVPQRATKLHNFKVRSCVCEG